MTPIGWLYIIIIALALWAIVATILSIVIMHQCRLIRRAERLAEQQRKEQEELSKRPMDYTL